MKLIEIKELLKADFICGQEFSNEVIEFAGGADLMSDVLALGRPGILLLTGLTNAQSVRTAHIIEAKAVIYVRGKLPENAGIRLALEKRIPLLSTKMMMYQACGLLYIAGLEGVQIQENP